MSLFAALSHLHPITATIFVGTIVEGVTSVVLVVFWTAIVAIRANATNGLIGLEDAAQQVQSANLYYASWAGFITSILIAVEYARVAFGVDAASTIRGQAKRLDLWSGLLCFTVVVLGSCARTIKIDCRDGNDELKPDGYCPRTKFGVAASVFGVTASLAMIYLKIKAGGAPFLTEAYVSMFLVICETLSVALLTSASGPGSAVGNLYYFSWASFIMSAYILFSCYGEWSGHDESADPTVPSNPNTTEQPNLETYTNGDIEVETFDESKI